MIALIQRVKKAQVDVQQKTIGKINNGLLVLLGVEKTDSKESAERLMQKVINYRVFSDNNGKMNLSLLDTNGELLIVSQFTLVANTNKGLRPSFSSAASPDLSKELYQYTIDFCKSKLKGRVETGQFGADMQVSLINDGPVTFEIKI